MQRRIVKFRPLRRNKKTGKIIVASYMSWYKVQTANYNAFDLIVDNEYRSLPKNERVCNHKGEDLFFFKYRSKDIKTYTPDNYPKGANFGTPYIIDYGEGSLSCNGIGMDVSGTPCLSHYTTDRLSNDNYNLDMVEPLTVGIVLDWYAWFLFRLDKANIKVKNEI